MIDLKALWEEEESKRIQDFLDNKRFSSSAILRYQTGGLFPKKPLPISDLREFERRKQLYNDSLLLHNLSYAQYNAMPGKGDVRDISSKQIYQPSSETVARRVPKGGKVEQHVYKEPDFKINTGELGIADYWHPEIAPTKEYRGYSQNPNNLLNMMSVVLHGMVGKDPRKSSMNQLYDRPIQPVIYAPKVATEISQPQKAAVEKRPEQTVRKPVEQSQSEIRPRVIVKRLDTTGNIVGQDTVSPSSVNRRFDADTKSWKQYQTGGPVPTKADSLFLLNNNRIIQDLLNKGYEWRNNIPISDPPFNSKKEAIDAVKKIYARDTDKSKGISRKGSLQDYLDVKGEMVGSSDWRPGGDDDKGVPMQYVHPNIAPQFRGDLVNLRSTAPSVFSYGYSDLAITPWDMLTTAQKADRRMIYGDAGTPFDTTVTPAPVKTVPALPIRTPVPAPVLNVEPVKQKVMATPKMGIEEKPQWFKDRQEIAKMKQYIKPERPRQNMSTAKLYGNPNVNYRYGGKSYLP